MRLYTVLHEKKEIVAVTEEDNIMYSINSLGFDAADMNELILNWDKLEIKIRRELKKRKASPISDYKLLAPIVTPLQDIVCLGVNYYNHIEETKAVTDFTEQEAAVYFSKRVNKCTGPYGNIPYYDFVNSLDYEAELGVILKKDAFCVSEEEASDYILGYTIINDVSARDLQLKHKQWYFGKSLDGYTVLGPCIVTADEIGDAHELGIRCYVNDELRQDSNTRYMITSVQKAVSELSRGMTLKAGTIIATGTPGGVGMGMKPPAFLKTGDIVRCEIEQIGKLENCVQTVDEMV